MVEAKRAPSKPKRERKPRASGAAGRKGHEGQKRLRVKQVRSRSGRAETYRRTLIALGLRHHQQEIVVNDTPSVRGMLHKVRHLVQVSEEA